MNTDKVNNVRQKYFIIDGISIFFNRLIPKNTVTSQICVRKQDSRLFFVFNGFRELLTAALSRWRLWECVFWTGLVKHVVRNLHVKMYYLVLIMN